MLIITQAQYKINDVNTFNIENLVIENNRHYAFVGANGSGKSLLAQSLSGDLLLLAGEYKTTFKKIVRLSFEQLQKKVEIEWNKNNTDLLSEGENDTGKTAKEIILDDNPEVNQTFFLQLVELFDISSLLTRRFKYLSTGETRKVLLCQSLLLAPDLLILDEPFDGLDVLSRNHLKTLLATIAKQPITLVLILNRFDEVPDFIQQVGLLSECVLRDIGPKETLLSSEYVTRLTELEKQIQNDLPPSDVPTTILDQSIPRVILNNCYVHYNDKPIIQGLTWCVNAGENWQIIGPNGAGKSTLLSLITGDHPQSYSNDLTLFGRRRGSGETIWDIKRHIGYVSNQLHLDYRINISVKNVIISGFLDSIGIYEAISDRQDKLADQWLMLLNLTHKAHAPFQSLSWGQQRLILIVRALVKHPTLLILDEPLQGLDWFNRELIKRWVDYLINEGNTQLFFVSHHKEDGPNCITHRLMYIPDEQGYRHQLEQVN